MRRKFRHLIIFHDTHPNDVNDNYTRPNCINTIDTGKNIDFRSNDTLRNDVNNRDTNSNNFKTNSSDTYNINNTDAEKNIGNVELYYN